MSGTWVLGESHVSCLIRGHPNNHLHHKGSISDAMTRLGRWLASLWSVHIFGHRFSPPALRGYGRRCRRLREPGPPSTDPILQENTIRHPREVNGKESFMDASCGTFHRVYKDCERSDSIDNTPTQLNSIHSQSPYEPLSYNKTTINRPRSGSDVWGVYLGRNKGRT